MITSDHIEQLLASVAETVKIDRGGDNLFQVDVPLQYPDGDGCRLFARPIAGGRWWVSDGGDACARASYVGADVDTDTDFAERVSELTRFRGLTDRDGELGLETDSPGRDIFRVAQSAIDVVHMANLPATPHRNNKAEFTARLEAVVHSCADASRITENWFDKTVEHGDLYKVPFQIEPSEANKKQLLLFGVTGSLSCVHNAMAVMFWRANAKSSFIVAVYDEAAQISRRDKARLNHQCSKVLTRLDESNLRKSIESLIA